MIYLDHAATTPCRPEVAREMAAFLTDTFGNPSSIHAYGQEARRGLDRARDRVAAAIGARGEEIIFTGSGTEADNLALIGSFMAGGSDRAGPGRKNHLVTVTTEHHAILHTVETLRAMGAEATLVPVDSEGRVDPEAIRRAVRPETFLISVMAANNEIGTLAPLAEISEVARELDVPLHTDAVQVIGALPFQVDAPRVDMLTLTAHKFYGPKGAGALYVRRGTPLKPILHGGGQERGRRPGTENVPAIMGLALALELALRDMPAESARQTVLRDQLIQRVLAEVPGAVLNGHPTLRLPNNTNFSFPGLESDLLLVNLDLEGVAASSGSACTAGAIEPSHVLAALGLGHARAISAVRLTLGRGTSAEHVDTAAETLGRIVTRLTA